MALISRYRVRRKYQMEIDHVNKSASFKRVTPLQTRIVFLAEMQNMLFGNLARREGLARLAWRRSTAGPAKSGSARRLAPGGRNHGSLQQVLVRPLDRGSGESRSVGEAYDSGQLHQCFLVDKVERDIELPAGIFDTTPPTDYTLANTKETAPLDSFSHTTYTGPTLETVRPCRIRSARRERGPALVSPRTGQG